MDGTLKGGRVAGVPSNCLIQVIALMILVLSTAGFDASVQALDTAEKLTVDVNIGDTLFIQSDVKSIQKVQIRGNLTNATFPRQLSFPANKFFLSANVPARYNTTILFDFPTGFEVSVVISSGNPQPQKIITDYFVSSGQLILSLEASYIQPSDEGPLTLQKGSHWESFSEWMANFHKSFPLWTKAVYLILGAQFILVGVLWIRRESQSRLRAHFSAWLDRGNLIYISTDLLYKFLLSSLLVISIIVASELILTLLLRLMPLAEPQLVSMWDLYVLGFSAGITLLAFLFRVFFDRCLDLKPLECE